MIFALKNVNFSNMFCFVFLLVISSTFAGVPRRDGRIVGGSETDIQKEPFMVSIHYNGKFICGGTIVNTHYVLTSASCVHLKIEASLQIRAGSTEYNEGGHTHEVLIVKKHNSYNSETHEYDFALIKVSPAFKLGTLGVESIKLEENDQGEDGEIRARVLGWGYTCAECPLALKLQEVEVDVIAREVCQLRYKGINQITQRMLCAKAQGKDRCDKDEGGPLIDIRTNKQIGIVSFGKGCADPMYPGVYGNIASAITWIKNIISETC